MFLFIILLSCYSAVSQILLQCGFLGCCLIIVSMIVQSHSMSSALRDGSVNCVQCSCAVWKPGRWWHCPVSCGSGCEMRSRPLAGCVADSTPVEGGMLTASTTDHCPFVQCRDVGVQQRYCLLDRHQQPYSCGGHRPITVMKPKFQKESMNRNYVETRKMREPQLDSMMKPNV